MRPLVSLLAVASLLAGPALAPAALAEPCARPTELQAFEVASLKSELMVIAIACQAQERYNDFVARYRRDLQSGERVLNAYFARTAGRRAQQRHDDYITNLANTQSESGVQQGTLFCQQHMAMFDEVMALKEGKELPSYAESKSLAQPVAPAACPAPSKNLHTASDK
ncbi:MAG: hypothetical protein M0Z28_06775 [Rhodospirillales bacterium]|nr:hypothetical protein [Rhodospirillales bacterium]